MTQDELTHTITIEVTGRYPHGLAQSAMVRISGSGDLDHMLETFRAALVAAGFSSGMAERLDVLGEAA